MSEHDKLEYFIARTDSRLSHIESKLDQVLAFKFMILGGSGLVSVIVSLVCIYLESKK